MGKKNNAKSVLNDEDGAEKSTRPEFHGSLGL